MQTVPPAAVGDQVRLLGLKAQPELNGLFGRVAGPWEGDRIAVKLDKALNPSVTLEREKSWKHTYMLRPQNFELQRPAAADDATSDATHAPAAEQSARPRHSAAADDVTSDSAHDVISDATHDPAAEGCGPDDKPTSAEAVPVGRMPISRPLVCLQLADGA